MVIENYRVVLECASLNTKYADQFNDSATGLHFIKQAIGE